MKQVNDHMTFSKVPNYQLAYIELQFFVLLAVTTRSFSTRVNIFIWTNTIIAPRAASNAGEAVHYFCRLPSVCLCVRVSMHVCVRVSAQ